MVIVIMRQQYGLQLLLFLQGEAGSKASGIYRQYVIKHEGGHFRAGRLTVMGAQDMYIHLFIFDVQADTLIAG